MRKPFQQFGYLVSRFGVKQSPLTSTILGITHIATCVLYERLDASVFRVTALVYLTIQIILQLLKRKRSVVMKHFKKQGVQFRCQLLSSAFAFLGVPGMIVHAA